jgi:hypothetical protein
VYVLVDQIEDMLHCRSLFVKDGNVYVLFCGHNLLDVFSSTDNHFRSAI